MMSFRCSNSRLVTPAEAQILLAASEPRPETRARGHGFAVRRDAREQAMRLADRIGDVRTERPHRPLHVSQTLTKRDDKRPIAPRFVLADQIPHDLALAVELFVRRRIS